MLLFLLQTSFVEDNDNAETLTTMKMLLRLPDLLNAKLLSCLSGWRRIIGDKAGDTEEGGLLQPGKQIRCMILGFRLIHSQTLPQ